MKLYFLLEGRRTEPKLYRSWISHVFPGLPEVRSVAGWRQDGFFLLSGGGQPGIFDRVPEAIRDVQREGVDLSAFFLCIDSEEHDETAVYDHASKVLQRHALPTFQPVVVVQHCCIESWLLGDRALYRPSARDPQLREYRNFYNAAEKDPEHMPAYPGFATRAKFHERYLKSAARDIGSTYSKTKPGGYFHGKMHLRSLVARHRDTDHIKSFGRLAESLESLGGQL